MDKIERIMNSLDKLPTLPTIYTKLSRLLHAPDSTARMISDAIAEDQVVAAKVLKLANSSFYGFAKRIGTLQHAVVILGMNEIKTLVLATSVVKTFHDYKSGHTFDVQEFWEHSLACATASRVLAEAGRLSSPEEVFAGGLLHDIGKLIYALFFSEDFACVMEEVENNEMPIITAEKKIMGLSHADVGRALAVKWNLPEGIVKMISGHHVSEKNTDCTKEIAAVNLGNTLCIALGMVSWGERKVPCIHDSVWRSLGIKISDLEFIIMRINSLCKENSSILEN
ncbi:MAG: HDOD domain-containing protein [Deltaproteobacteria bacterium]|nr:HDOD domain-containing protein [Deltaproteobacteria bacterium]